MRAVTVLVWATLEEAVRRKVALAAVLAGGAFLFVYGFAFHFSLKDPPTEPAKLVVFHQVLDLQILLGLYAAVLLTGLLAVLAGSDALAGDVASGAIHTLLSKPIGRWQIFVGKGIGLGSFISLFLGFVGGGVMLIARLEGGIVAPHFGLGLGLAWMDVMVLLAVALLCSTRMSTLASGAVSLGLFGMAFLGGWIEQIGALTRHQHVVQMGVIASLIMPSEALWRRAAFEMQSPVMAALAIGPFASASVPDRLMIGYAGVYLLVAVGLALRWFSRRDF